MNDSSTPRYTSDLAEKVRQKQAEDQRRIEAILSDYESSLRNISNESLKRLDQDMANLRMEIAGQMRRSLPRLAVTWGIALVAILIALIATGWTTWDATTITSQHVQIRKQRQNLKSLKNIQTHKCGQKMCVKIRPGKKYGPNNDYRIIQPSK